MVPYKPPDPEKVPQFPYSTFGYTHIHPQVQKYGKLTHHILFRGHDCWCEPLVAPVLSARGKRVAILVVHQDHLAPEFPDYAVSANTP